MPTRSLSLVVALAAPATVRNGEALTSVGLLTFRPVIAAPLNPMSKASAWLPMLNEAEAKVRELYPPRSTTTMSLPGTRSTLLEPVPRMMVIWSPVCSVADPGLTMSLWPPTLLPINTSEPPPLFRNVRRYIRSALSTSSLRWPQALTMPRPAEAKSSTCVETMSGMSAWGA